MNPLVFRVQDAAGRGPFKPGRSQDWRDAFGPERPTWFEEFGNAWRSRVPGGWHIGCALPDLETAARWFSAEECRRLAALGYSMFALRPGTILCRSPWQFLIASPRPFQRGAKPAPWPHT